MPWVSRTISFAVPKGMVSLFAAPSPETVAEPPLLLQHSLVSGEQRLAIETTLHHISYSYYEGGDGRLFGEKGSRPCISDGFG